MKTIARWGVTHSVCPVCQANFEPEPGFYFGAMFISYAFSVAWGAALWVLLYVLFRPDSNTYTMVIAAGVVLLSPWSFRYSRVLWLYWFGGIGR